VASARVVAGSSWMKGWNGNGSSSILRAMKSNGAEASQIHNNS
jgi:hypothetical protein